VIGQFDDSLPGLIERIGPRLHAEFDQGLVE
jgi:hypothetical protein